MTFPTMQVAKLLCEASSDDWRSGKGYWLGLASRIEALAAATGTAKTPQGAECEASQSGGAAVTPNPCNPGDNNE